MALAAVTWRNGHLLPSGATIEQIDEERDVWTYVVFFASLLHDIAKPLTDLRIQWRAAQMPEPLRWTPVAGSLVQLAQGRRGAEYLVEFTPKSMRDYGAHSRLAVTLLGQIAPPSALSFMARTPQAMEALVQYLSGLDKTSLVARIVSRADQASTQKSLLSGSRARFDTATSVPLIELLMSALKSMLNTGTALPLNRSGAAGWVHDGSVWLVAKRVADAVRSWIHQHAPDESIPGDKKNDRLFDTWQEYGCIQPNPHTGQPPKLAPIRSAAAKRPKPVTAPIRNAGSDIRLVEDMARNATIEDPQVLASVQRFYSECFIPARSRYLAMNRADLSASGNAFIAPGNRDYGPSDVDWMGSQLFRTEPGFYADMRSYNPVPGFAIDFSRDTDYYNPASGMEPPHPGIVNPEWGRPTCKQWWEDRQQGVRERMIGHSSTWTKLVDAAGNVMNWPTEDQRKDSFAKLAQKKANPSFVDQDRVMGTEYDTTTTIGRRIGGAVSTLGVGMSAAVASVAVTPLITALPMMQALVLMGVYMFLPLIAFLSGFNLRVMFYGAVAIFTIKLWAAMWFIAQWIDARLINAMYPGSQGNVFLQELTHIASGSIPQGYKRMVLNILLLALFIGLPMIWTALMGWIGINIGSHIHGMMKESGEGAKRSASSSTSLATRGRVR